MEQELTDSTFNAMLEKAEIAAEITEFNVLLMLCVFLGVFAIYGIVAKYWHKLRSVKMVINTFCAVLICYTLASTGLDSELKQLVVGAAFGIIIVNIVLRSVEKIKFTVGKVNVELKNDNRHNHAEQAEKDMQEQYDVKKKENQNGTDTTT
jgi:amino acid transporter